MSQEQELAVVQQAMDISRRRREWSDEEDKLAQALGHRYRGRDTDWDAISVDVWSTEDLLANWKGRPTALAELLTDQDKAAVCQDRAASASYWSEQVRSLLHEVGPKELTLIMSGESDLFSLTNLLRESMSALHRLRSAILEPLRVAREPFNDLDTLAAFLEDGARLREIEREHDQVKEALGADFQGRFNGFDTDWNEIAEVLKWTEELQVILDSKRASDTLREHCTDPKGPEYYKEAADSIRGALASFDGEVSPLEERFDFGAGPWDTCTEAHFDDVKKWTDELSENADSASDWLIYLAAVGELEDALCDSVVDDIRSATDDAGHVPDIVLRRITLAWLDWVYKQEALLADFTSADYDEIRSRFKDLDEKLPVAAQNEIRNKVFERYPSRFTTSSRAGQLGILQGELSRRRRQMPVRRLFTRIPDLIQTIKPCFLVSPLAVSQYLPISNLASETLGFDMVIFDEASQVFPEDAVPAILRGKQLILAGDRKQLPPSNFWRRSLSEDDDTIDDDDDDSQPDQFVGRESILDVAVGQIGNLFTEGHLNVHYRSKDERLIQFSNHYFYDDRLLTFPSPGVKDSWYGLHDVYVPDGIYDGGYRNAPRTNRIEAEKVVDLVFEHMRTRPADESIGVVALSRTQADLVMRLVDERRLGERDLDQRFNEDVVEPFFVKNLENVQGDERDHMVMCIGYGPTASGRPYNRFGPINN